MKLDKIKKNLRQEPIRQYWLDSAKSIVYVYWGTEAVENEKLTWIGSTNNPLTKMATQAFLGGSKSGYKIVDTTSEKSKNQNKHNQND